MAPSLKLYLDLDSNLVAPSVYRQWIGFLMCLVNISIDICFAVKTLSQFMVEPRQSIEVLEACASAFNT
jgi:hypothetical protein